MGLFLPSAALNPGDAVAVALAVGDITIAGTGTVSLVDGRRITAFGHPMLGIGDVALPLCASEIVAILPSNLNSMKVSNTGPVIGTLLQDPPLRRRRRTRAQDPDSFPSRSRHRSARCASRWRAIPNSRPLPPPWV
jgi:hypothetical protein